MRESHHHAHNNVTLFPQVMAVVSSSYSPSQLTFLGSPAHQVGVGEVEGLLEVKVLGYHVLDAATGVDVQPHLCAVDAAHSGSLK